MLSKQCTRCKLTKPIADFCKNIRRKDGLQAACKTCMNISYNSSRKKNQIRYQQVAKDRYAANTKRIRAWKEDKGCILCSEKFGPCLELHHLDPAQKEFDPSEGSNKSWESFLIEAAKCVLLCANCHRKVHAGILTL